MCCLSLTASRLHEIDNQAVPCLDTHIFVALPPFVIVQVSCTSQLRRIPRFGHTNDFAALFESRSTSSDYIQGILFYGCLAFGGFLFWATILLVLKCLGRKRVGFWSGHAFRHPEDHSRIYRLPVLSRVTFLVAGVVLIAAVVLFVAYGLINIRSSAQIINNSASVSANTI